MNKIIVGIIIDTALRIPPNTGVTYRLYYMSRKLAEKGLGIKIFLCNRNISNDKDTEILIENSSIEYHVIPEKIFYNTREMKRIVEKNLPDILQFEDPVSLLRYQEVTESLGIPSCLEMHDVEATLKELLGYCSEEVKEAQHISFKACRLAQKVICMTPLDFNELINKIGVIADKLAIVPNPIDLDCFPYFGPNLKSFNIIFIGNMFYWPNQNAVEHIAKKIYPEVTKKIKKIKFYLTGMVPRETKRKLEKNNFIFTESVNNLNSYLNNATIALCPVTEGSGMKVKLLNYCAAGLPIITTKIGASGYEKIKSLIIEDDLDKYSKIICNLFANQKKLKKVGKCNRFAIESYYDLNKIADKMIKIYKNILSKPHSLAKQNMDTKLPLPLWLEEKRVRTPRNKNYYIIKNGKVIFKKALS